MSAVEEKENGQENGIAEGGEGVDGKKRTWGPPGLTDAITDALQPHAGVLGETTLEDLVKSMQGTLTKTGNKFAKDDRMKERGSSTDMQAVLEEVVSAALVALSNAHYDKEWLPEVDWSNALVAQCKHTFRGSKLVVRTLAPSLKKFVDEAIFRHKEDERIEKIMKEALTMSGLTESFHKRAQKNLDFSYNEAHMHAAYGETGASSPEMGLVQDFVKFWMTEFAARSWDILEQGIQGFQEDRFSFMTNLFVYMCHPSHSILPQDVVGVLDAPPPENWSFVQEQVHACLKELDENPAKRRKLGGWGNKSQGGGW